MILEAGKLTDVRARFPIAFVILLAAFACTGGPTGDYPADPTSGRLDAGTRPDDEDPQSPGAGNSADADSQGARRDAGSAVSELDAASPTAGPCDPLTDAGDAGDAGQADGGVAEASVAQTDAGDAAIDADADASNDGQVDTDANFPDAAGDAQPLLSDGSGDAPHMPFTSDACVP